MTIVKILGPPGITPPRGLRSLNPFIVPISNDSEIMSSNNANPAPRRVLINASVQQISGEPGARPWKIWELFCNHQLRRDARTTPHQSDPDLGVDEVHVLPNYDSPNNIKAYFLTDVGVKGGADEIDVAPIPFEVYRAAYDTARQQWYGSRKMSHGSR